MVKKQSTSDVSDRILNVAYLLKMAMPEPVSAI